MSRPHDVIARQMEHSGSTLLTALEPLDETEFFAVNANGFSAAWVTGHLAAVAELFSSWFDGDPVRDPAFHSVFNETSATAAARDLDAIRHSYSKDILLLAFRRATIKALRALRTVTDWDAPGPPSTPAGLTAGGVWERLAMHTGWHCGELAGSMKRFHGTYTLNTVSHYFYISPDDGGTA
jgi:hypothetical protein